MTRRFTRHPAHWQIEQRPEGELRGRCYSERMPRMRVFVLSYILLITGAAGAGSQTAPGCGGRRLADDLAWRRHCARRLVEVPAGSCAEGQSVGRADLRDRLRASGG